jgi:hypothetical protein
MRGCRKWSTKRAMRWAASGIYASLLRLNQRFWDRNQTVLSLWKLAGKFDTSGNCETHNCATCKPPSPLRLKSAVLGVDPLGPE